MKGLAVAGALVALCTLGALMAYVSHANDNKSLTAALEHIENGGIPDEPSSYAAAMDRDSKQEPSVSLAPGAYSNTTLMQDVTYRAVLLLKPNGRYDYALTVGNDRVYKMYKHAGLWEVKGQVFQTILEEGDAFLTPPAARDRKTPSRERIVEVGADYVVLQAHYGGPVKFEKVEQP